MPDPVKIARCPIHGLHGERTECFVCGGPVEQVPMVPAPGRPLASTSPYLMVQPAPTLTRGVWRSGLWWRWEASHGEVSYACGARLTEAAAVRASRVALSRLAAEAKR
jgi:hypothetical protein